MANAKYETIVAQFLKALKSSISACVVHLPGESLKVCLEYFTNIVLGISLKAASSYCGHS